jgi:NitT/TauT family transport system substrate-binding protein
LRGQLSKPYALIVGVGGLSFNAHSQGSKIVKDETGRVSRRRGLKLVAATGLVSATGLAAHAQSETKLLPVKVATSNPSIAQAPDYLLKPLKLDAKHGLDVELIPMGANSSLMVDAVMSRSATFACAGTITALQAIRQGADLMILGAFANNLIAAVISKAAMAKTGLTAASPAPDKIKAMKGMTIGTNPPGATLTQVFRGYLKKYGLNPDKDVRLVYMPDAQSLVAGIEQGRYDAIVSVSGIVEQAITRGAGNLWFAGATGEFPDAEKEVGAVVVAVRETVEKNHDLVKAFLDAMQDGLAVLNNDRDAAYALMYKQYFGKLDPAVWKLVMVSTTKGFPSRMTFTKAMYDNGINADPKGPESYKDVDYKQITYGPNQG